MEGAAMNSTRVETTIEADGELHLTALPCERGDRVEAVVTVLAKASGDSADSDRESVRAEALRRLLELAQSSTFRSTGPYPTRDEIHERF